MPTRYSQSVTAFAAVGSLAYGYASSIIAYTIGFPSFFDYMGLVANSDHSNSIIGAANGLYVRLHPEGSKFGKLMHSTGLISLVEDASAASLQLGPVRSSAESAACKLAVSLASLALVRAYSYMWVCVRADVLTVTAVLMCAAQNVPMFLVSRFIMGWSSKYSPFSPRSPD